MPRRRSVSTSRAPAEKPRVSGMLSIISNNMSKSFNFFYLFNKFLWRVTADKNVYGARKYIFLARILVMAMEKISFSLTIYSIVDIYCLKIVNHQKHLLSYVHSFRSFSRRRSRRALECPALALKLLRLCSEGENKLTCSTFIDLLFCVYYTANIYYLYIFWY